MSSMRATAVLFAAALVPAGASAQAFEGIVTYQVDTERGKSGEMQYAVKGTKIRVDFTTASMGGAAAGTYMLMDAASGRMATVVPAQKLYMTMDAKQMAGQQQEQDKDVAPPKIIKTGKTETIAGHTCEHYLIGDKQDVDVCVAKGLGTFMMGNTAPGMMRGMMNTARIPADYQQLAKSFKDGFFPLKIATVQSGKTQTVLEATKVEKKTLPASLFAPPTGYREVDMGKMMEQMRQQQETSRAGDS